MIKLFGLIIWFNHVVKSRQKKFMVQEFGLKKWGK
jgi:hypothetical protein